MWFFYFILEFENGLSGQDFIEKEAHCSDQSGGEEEEDPDRYDSSFINDGPESETEEASPTKKRPRYLHFEDSEDEEMVETNSATKTTAAKKKASTDSFKGKRCSTPTSPDRETEQEKRMVKKSVSLEFFKGISSLNYSRYSELIYDIKLLLEKQMVKSNYSIKQFQNILFFSNCSFFMTQELVYETLKQFEIEKFNTISEGTIQNISTDYDNFIDILDILFYNPKSKDYHHILIKGLDVPPYIGEFDENNNPDDYIEFALNLWTFMCS